MQPIQLAAYLTGFATKVDGSASIRFSTQELQDNDVLELKRRQGTVGWLCFAPNKVSDADIPKLDADLNSKTQSERIRGVLFRIHEKNGGTKETFPDYYYQQTEKIIDYLKEKLD